MQFDAHNLWFELLTRLDSMLFFWVFAGTLSVAGWARSAYREGVAAAAALREHAGAASNAKPLAATNGEPASLALAIQRELHTMGAATDSRHIIERAVEAGVRAALKSPAAADSAPPPPTTNGGEKWRKDGKVSAAIARAQHMVSTMGAQQWTCVAAIGACVMSGASLVVSVAGQRRT